MTLSTEGLRVWDSVQRQVGSKPAPACIFSLHLSGRAWPLDASKTGPDPNILMPNPLLF